MRAAAFLVAATVATLPVTACSGRAETLSIGASTEEPAPSLANTIADSLRAEGFQVSVVFFDQGGSVFAGLANGTLDIALVEEPLTPTSNATTLLPVYPSVLHVLHASPQAAGLSELLIGNVYAGPPGSLGHRLAARLADDLDVPDMRLLDDPWGESPNTYFVFGGLLPKDAIRQLPGFRLFDLAEAGQQDGESVIDAIALRYPNLRPFVLPAGLYPALHHPAVRTLAVNTLLAARGDLEEETAYRITEWLSENFRPIRAIYPLARAMALGELDPDELVLPLHRGARRFIERDRPSFVERYIDIIALLTTLLIGAISTAIGWAHRRKRARKDRVDRYLNDVLDVRTGIRSGGTGAWLEDLDAIEQDVLGLVANEQIEADTGLIAFLQLCAAVRAEIASTPR